MDTPRNMYNAELAKVQASPNTFNPNERASFFGNTFGNSISPQEYLGALETVYGPGSTWGKYGATPAPTGGSGGGTGSTFVDKSNDIALQNAGLSAADTQVNEGLSAVDRALGGIIGQYDTEKKGNEATYKTSSDTNQSNLQRNKETSLVNAAQGRRGLFGTLASLGALNGSGIDLANNAVQTGANQDLGAAADTYGGNQSALDTSIGTFRTEDEARRQQANQAAGDAKTNVRNQGAKNKQTFLKNLSDDYAAQGDAGQAKAYADQAASLYSEVANTSVPSSNLAYTGAAFTAPTLANYLTNANNTQVNSAPTTPGLNGIPGLVADNRKRLQPA